MKWIKLKIGDETHKKFKSNVASEGMTIQGALESLIKRVNNGEIELGDIYEW